MAMRSHAHQKSIKGSATDRGQNAWQSRPFPKPMQPTPELAPPDLQTQLENAQRFGHHLGRYQIGPPSSTPPLIQSKLTIGAPGDKYEQEADLVAQQVVQQLNAPRSKQSEQSIQRGTLSEEEDELQRKSILQRSSNDALITSGNVEQEIAQARGNGQPLANTIRQPMEQAFGADFRGVRIHADTQADQLNRSIQARAFTTGQDVFFRQGAYQPGSRGGRTLIAHELTHVVQQNRNTLLQQAQATKTFGNPQVDIATDTLNGELSHTRKTISQLSAFSPDEGSLQAPTLINSDTTKPLAGKDTGMLDKKRPLSLVYELGSTEQTPTSQIILQRQITDEKEQQEIKKYIEELAKKYNTIESDKKSLYDYVINKYENSSIPEVKEFIEFHLCEIFVLTQLSQSENVLESYIELPKKQGNVVQKVLEKPEVQAKITRIQISSYAKKQKLNPDDEEFSDLCQNIISNSKVPYIINSKDFIDQQLHKIFILKTLGQSENPLELSKSFKEKDDPLTKGALKNLEVENKIAWIEKEPDLAKWLQDKTLSDLDIFAQQNPGWHMNLEIKNMKKQSIIRALLKFARNTSALAGCSDMRVADLLSYKLIDENSKLNDRVSNSLAIYSDAVSGQINAVEWFYPTSIVSKAIEWGQSLSKILECPTFAAFSTKHLIQQFDLIELVKQGWVKNFVQYMDNCKPHFSAKNGTELRSYLTLMKAGVNPEEYINTNLKERIRNFHKFSSEALERLKLNYEQFNLPEEKRKPLTLILYSALDENGTFHHDVELTKVITNDTILTLLIEGKETLGEIKDQLAPLAKAYGKGEKIDQVMFAGHGQSRSMEMGGPKQQFETQNLKQQTLRIVEIDVPGNLATIGGSLHKISISDTALGNKVISEDVATKDFEAPNNEYLSFKKGDRIRYMKGNETHGFGECNYKQGWYWLKDVEAARPYYPAKATEDYDGKGPNPNFQYLSFSKGDVIKIYFAEFGAEDWAQGECKGKEGWVHLIYTDMIKEGGINLDREHNRTESDTLFEELIKQMGTDKEINPHLRVVFNACLTNSNQVKMILDDKNPEQARTQIKKYTEEYPSLAKYLRQQIGINSPITVIGANASTKNIALIDQEGALDLKITDDLEVTNPEKLAYVKTGFEPEGVMKAVLECWANQPENCLLTMQNRLQSRKADTWEEIVIQSLFKITIDKHWKNGEMIRQFALVASKLTHMQFEPTCRVNLLIEIGLDPNGATSSEAVNLFKYLQLDKMHYFMGLVFYQVWLLHDPSIGKELLDTLKYFDCQTAAQFIDVTFITKQLGEQIKQLLPLSSSEVTREQLLLAFRIIDDNPKHVHVKEYLLKVIGSKNDRFPENCNVNEILKGRPSEHVILQKLGIGRVTILPPNLDVTGSGNPEIYVRSVTLTGQIGKNTKVYKLPSQSEVLETVESEMYVEILGETKDDYCAIESSKAKNGTAFVLRSDITLV